MDRRRRGHGRLRAIRSLRDGLGRRHRVDALARSPAAPSPGRQATSETGRRAALRLHPRCNAVKAVREARLDPSLAVARPSAARSRVNESGDVQRVLDRRRHPLLRAQGGSCENTGAARRRRLSRVRSLAARATRSSTGVGEFDGALSEGIGRHPRDARSRTTTAWAAASSATTAPLRDLDPGGARSAGPTTSTGEVHDDGEIIGGTMWDLARSRSRPSSAPRPATRSPLEIFYGDPAARVGHPVDATPRRCVADDDDGDLANGTPNQCEINAAFGAHGLADPQRSRSASQPPTRDGFDDLDLHAELRRTPRAPARRSQRRGRVASCAAARRARVDARRAPATSFTGAIPTQPDGTRRPVPGHASSSSTAPSIAFPNNAADPFYEFYVGEVEPIWCSDFEGGARGTGPSARAGDRQWEVGTPRGPRRRSDAAPRRHERARHRSHRATASTRRATMTFAETPGDRSRRATPKRAPAVPPLARRRGRLLRPGAHPGRTAPRSGRNFASAHGAGRPTSTTSIASGGSRTSISRRTPRPARSSCASSSPATQGLQLGGWTLDDVCIVTPFIAPPGGGDDDDGMATARRMTPVTTTPARRMAMRWAAATSPAAAARRPRAQAARRRCRSSRSSACNAVAAE